MCVYVCMCVSVFVCLFRENRFFTVVTTTFLVSTDSNRRPPIKESVGIGGRNRLV